MSNLTDYTGGTWATLLDKPAVIAAGVDAAAARTSIGAGTSSFSGDYNDLANKPTLGTAAATAATAYATAAQGTKADSALQPAALTNTALAGVPTAPNAATGTNTTQLATTAFVNAEIAADAAPIAHVGSGGTAHAEVTTSVSGFMSAADKTKLDSIATAATANATDAALRDRATHTGTQAISTVTGLDTALAGKAPLDGTGTSGSWPISVTGNAATATKLTTARTINGVSFDGTANITVADSTKLPTAGGTMTGAITFAAGQTWPTFNQSTTGNAATATKLATARTIGGVSFDGSANIDLPGVNTTGNQNTTGNAATATKLATARTINGVAFDGTANVTITAQPVFAQQHSDNTSNGIPFAAGVEYSLRVNGTYSRSTPASPAIGDKFILNNLYDTWGSGLFTLTRGSPNHKINNIQEDVIFDVNVRRVELTYIYANEWIMAIS